MSTSNDTQSLQAGSLELAAYLRADVDLEESHTPLPELTDPNDVQPLQARLTVQTSDVQASIDAKSDENRDENNPQQLQAGSFEKESDSAPEIKSKEHHVPYPSPIDLSNAQLLQSMSLAQASGLGAETTEVFAEIETIIADLQSEMKKAREAAATGTMTSNEYENVGIWAHRLKIWAEPLRDAIPTLNEAQPLQARPLDLAADDRRAKLVAILTHVKIQMERVREKRAMGMMDSGKLDNLEVWTQKLIDDTQRLIDAIPESSVPSNSLPAPSTSTHATNDATSVSSETLKSSETSDDSAYAKQVAHWQAEEIEAIEWIRRTRNVPAQSVGPANVNEPEVLSKNSSTDAVRFQPPLRTFSDDFSAILISISPFGPTENDIRRVKTRLWVQNYRFFQFKVEDLQCSQCVGRMGFMRTLVSLPSIMEPL
jgi:hypothetical protein